MINTRQDLAKHFNELGFKTGAEIGVLMGNYSKVLCETIPDLKLYCVDSWGTKEIRYRKYHLRAYERAKAKLARYNTILVRKLSMDAVGDFKDESLDFVYLDANHNVNYVKEDLNEWSKKVRKGGIVSGHDYHLTHLEKSMGVTDAVNNYVKSNGLDLYLTANESETLSWWFVKK